VDGARIKTLLGRFRREMRNSPEEDLFPAAFFELSFNYAIPPAGLEVRP